MKINMRNSLEDTPKFTASRFDDVMRNIASPSGRRIQRVCVTGYKGRIGSRLVALGAVPLDCDVTDEEAVKGELLLVHPDVVVHAASIASVAECEKDYERAIQVNFRGTNIVCQEAKRVGAKVVYLSTEQVFDGIKGNYSEEDEPNPINDYGRSKLGGEAVAKLYDGKIIRLSRGISREKGKDIDNYILALQGDKKINVPDFIKRSYSHLDFLADGVLDFAQRYEEMPNLLHFGGTVSVSFHLLMFYIAEGLGLNTNLVIPRSTEIKELPRPLNCGFDVSLAESLNLPVAPIFNSTERLEQEYARV